VPIGYRSGPLGHTRLKGSLGQLGLLLLVGHSVPAWAQATGQDWLDQKMGAWYRVASKQAPGHWGIAVADLDGQVLWSINPDDPLIPASTVKVFTTGFARSVLGSSARRPTRVVGSGKVDPGSGQWIGSWSLELNGDPSFERGPGAGPTLYDLALQLSSSGIRKLVGPLNVQSSDGAADAVFPSVWSRHHFGRLFAPLIGPITINENLVWVVVQPGSRPGVRPRMVAESPEGIGSLVTIKATTRSGRRSSLALRARPEGGWVVTGAIGVRARPRRLAAVAADPKVVLAAAWTRALQRAGITWNPASFVGAPPSAAPRVLAEVSSPPLDSLASEINRRSLNYGAELLLQWAGGRETPASRLMQHVQQVTGTSAGLQLVDGSGLSYDDRVTARTFIAYLAKFPAMPEGRNFPQLLPANGTGTLYHLASGLPSEGVVRAKTGTLAQVANVVGYLGRDDGVLLVALLYNGSRPWAARKVEWKLFRDLGAHGVVIPSDTLPESVLPHLGGENESDFVPAWKSDSTDTTAVDDDSLSAVTPDSTTQD
jgi:D-alanyl-D-alanine carboxypeptidase/D-alanyl-D-alanine-endopeptidase (penicillin-binding protein 4)